MGLRFGLGLQATYATYSTLHTCFSSTQCHHHSHKYTVNCTTVFRDPIKHFRETCFKTWQLESHRFFTPYARRQDGNKSKCWSLLFAHNWLIVKLTDRQLSDEDAFSLHFDCCVALKSSRPAVVSHNSRIYYYTLTTHLVLVQPANRQIPFSKLL